MPRDTDEAGDDIGLGQSLLGGGGAEAGVEGKARVGVDLENIRAPGWINPEIDAGIPRKFEQVPGGTGEAGELGKQRVFARRKNARRARPVAGCGRRLRCRSA